ncbi:hypothetical protein [Streptomyces sp. JNUCC 63]
MKQPPVTFVPDADNQHGVIVRVGRDRVGKLTWYADAGWCVALTDPRTGQAYESGDWFATLPEAVVDAEAVIAAWRARNGRPMNVPDARVTSIPAGGDARYRR